MDPSVLICIITWVAIVDIPKPGYFSLKKTLRLEELYLRPDESGGGRFELKGMGFRRDQAGGRVGDQLVGGWGLGVAPGIPGGGNVVNGVLGGVQLVLQEFRTKKHIIYI